MEDPDNIDVQLKLLRQANLSSSVPQCRRLVVQVCIWIASVYILVPGWIVCNLSTV